MRKDVHWLHPWIAIKGRAPFTLSFFVSGVTHFTDIESDTRLMPAAVPWREFGVLISVAVELAGATIIVTNRYPRLGARLPASPSVRAARIGAPLDALATNPGEKCRLAQLRQLKYRRSDKSRT